jgi:hypothetical protein
MMMASDHTVLLEGFFLVLCFAIEREAYNRVA